MKPLRSCTRVKLGFFLGLFPPKGRDAPSRQSEIGNAGNGGEFNVGGTSGFSQPTRSHAKCVNKKDLVDGRSCPPCRQETLVLS